DEAHAAAVRWPWAGRGTRSRRRCAEGAAKSAACADRFGTRACLDRSARAAAARPAPVTLPAPEAVKSNGLGTTPPMRRNSWNKFRNQVSDKMVREIADAMVSSGMKSAGYVYVNIDDTWESAHRDAQGNITTNNKFPDMKALADYVHSKGLKLGIYSSPGP